MELANEMHNALIADHEALIQGEQATHRFMLLERLEKTLRKKNVQENFLELGGCRFLETWLAPHPQDGSIPPL